jgi:hypothetical protein
MILRWFKDGFELAWIGLGRGHWDRSEMPTYSEFRLNNCSRICSLRFTDDYLAAAMLHLLTLDFHASSLPDEVIGIAPDFSQ